MNASTVFTMASAGAGVAWLFLIAAARWMPRAFAAARVVVPLLFAAAYVVVLVSAWPFAGGFGSLADVSLLFRNEWVLLAGWIHYLAFDFFVGCWVLETGKTSGVPHWLVAPTLVLTFMWGPAGYLVFQAIRWTRDSRRR